MFSLERADGTRRVGLWSLVGLLLVPLVLAGGFLAATWGSTDRLDRVQAAVRQAGRHRQVAPQDGLQPVDALAGAGVHLVGHGRRADLTRSEPLGGQVVAGHQPDGERQVRRPGSQLQQRRHHRVVQRAGVDLADRVEHGGDAERPAEAVIELAGGLG